MNKILKEFHERKFKPMYWIGLIAVIFAAAGIDFETLTDWPLFLDALLSIVKNPVSIIAVITAIIGIHNNPATKGLGD